MVAIYGDFWKSAQSLIMNHPLLQVERNPSSVFSLLLDMYRKNTPRYGKRAEEYKLNLKKAENAKRKSSFPDIKIGFYQGD